MKAQGRPRVRARASARIVIFLNPQEKAYCNNPHGSDSKPAVHSMYLSYLSPPPPFISNPPAGSSITGCRSTSYTLLTRYKSHTPLNRTNARAFAWNPEESVSDTRTAAFPMAAKKTRFEGGKPRGWIVERRAAASAKICTNGIRKAIPEYRRGLLFYGPLNYLWSSDCSYEFI